MIILRVTFPTHEPNYLTKQSKNFSLYGSKSIILYNHHDLDRIFASCRKVLFWKCLILHKFD